MKTETPISPEFPVPGWAVPTAAEADAMIEAGDPDYNRCGDDTEAYRMLFMLGWYAGFQRATEILASEQPLR